MHLKETKLVLVVTDKHVLCLAVMIQHHFVVLTAKTRLLVPSEGGVGRIQVLHRFTEIRQ